MPHVYYEVNLEIHKEIAEEYMAWLRPHSMEMLHIDGFTEVTIQDFDNVAAPNDSNIVTKRVTYKVESMEKLQQYFDNQAKKMRGGGVSKFGNKFKAWRRVLKPESACKRSKL